MQGRRHQCSSRQCKSPPTNIFLLECRSVVGQLVERLQHFNPAAVQNFNAAVSFPSGAYGSLGYHSVASPPRGRPWRLSPLVVLRIISMMMLLMVSVQSRNLSACVFSLYYYVLLILSLLLYVIWRPFIIPRFAEIF